MEYLPYAVDESGCATCQLVAAYGEVELEYAAIRRGAGILDSPHRGTILVTGDRNERREFLNRMLTQELKDLTPGMCKPSFWLNRKGRIEADLLLIELGNRMLIDVDVHQASSAVATLSSFIVMEDVKIEDATANFRHVQIHGPAALQILASVAASAPQQLQPGAAAELNIAGAQVVAARRDLTGEIGLELIIPTEHHEAVWRALTASSPSAERATASQPPLPADRTQPPAPQISHVRPIGWHAFNIARIEAGTPLFNIDFSSDNLPHESGILRQRVSFTKGCYLGQEVVARMENLGKPKQTLVGLKMRQDRLPSAGEQVLQAKEEGSAGDVIGVITSSTLSPMLSAMPIAFAMIKSAHAAPGTLVRVQAEGEIVEAMVGPLRGWPAPETPSQPPAQTALHPSPSPQSQAQSR